jgi:broad specificity phosphatase PhoE
MKSNTNHKKMCLDLDDWGALLPSNICYQGTGKFSVATATRCSSHRRNKPHVEQVDPPEPSLSDQKPQIKMLHWIRHGHGTHNAAYEEGRRLGLTWRKNIKGMMSAPELLDARLTTKGEEQARLLGEALRSGDHLKNVELVIVSPLSRALQTACIALEGTAVHHLDLQSAQECTNTQQCSAGDKNKFIVVEILREMIDEKPCERRREISELEDEFPRCDFSSIASSDPLWYVPCCGAARVWSCDVSTNSCSDTI